MQPQSQGNNFVGMGMNPLGNMGMGMNSMGMNNNMNYMNNMNNIGMGVE